MTKSELAPTSLMKWTLQTSRAALRKEERVDALDLRTSHSLTCVRTQL